jgi:hypothetical protein
VVVVCAPLCFLLTVLLAGISGCALEPVRPLTPQIGIATDVVTPTPLPPTATPSVQATATLFATPTAEPGGRTLVLSPRAADVGWWGSAESGSRHIGDSFLYAGYDQGQAYVSAVRFDLSRVPPGAPLRQAMVHITGLQADRLQAAAGAQWSAQLLAPGAAPSLSQVDFQKLFNAPSAVALLPALSPQDLGELADNTWILDASGQRWLDDQIASGAHEVVLRLAGPAGGINTLFAWDSGFGPSSRGEGPQLILSLGPVLVSPTPTVTPMPIVVVPTQTPGNVLTAAAQALTATAMASSQGTFTPLPDNAVTPTPVPANLATEEALGYPPGLPAVVADTPSPANPATATANADYATAVAVTTGTFTPVPTGAVTPRIILPTDIPTNVMTAAAQMLAVTAQAATVGTATPLPYGAVVATVTPYWVVTSTPWPDNQGTAVALAVYATAVAQTTGTFTPAPPGAVTATPLPLLLYAFTPLPSATPTSTPLASMPQWLVGLILFHSDRGGGLNSLNLAGGSIASITQELSGLSGPGDVYALNPLDGSVAWVTQDWPYPSAQARDAVSADGKRSVIVRTVMTGGLGNIPVTSFPQLVVLDSQYQTERQITHDLATSYDPAWSPKADRIVFVSNRAGSDDIYTINADGSDLRRLTISTWEWNKHPSWSPDGTQIVFWSNRATGRRQLWIVNADGTGLRLLLNSPYGDWDPVWVK